MISWLRRRREKREQAERDRVIAEHAALHALRGCDLTTHAFYSKEVVAAKLQKTLEVREWVEAEIEDPLLRGGYLGWLDFYERTAHKIEEEREKHSRHEDQVADYERTHVVPVPPMCKCPERAEGDLP